MAVLVKKQAGFELEQDITCIKTELILLLQNSKPLVNQRHLFWHVIRKEYTSLFDRGNGGSNS